MTPSTSNYQTFAEIARETAKRHHGGSWRAYSDDILSSLLNDFWCGRFINDKGQSCTFDFKPRQTGAQDSITREVVWRSLGDARPRIVCNFWGDNPPPWDLLATAKIEEYGNGPRPFLENLALSVADAGTWMGQYDEENLPPRPGRPTLMPEIKKEMRRRAKEGELSPSMYKESRCLRDWAEDRYSDRLAHIPTKETIETKLGPIYRELRTKPAS